MSEKMTSVPENSLIEALPPTSDEVLVQKFFKDPRANDLIGEPMSYITIKDKEDIIEEIYQYEKIIRKDNREKEVKRDADRKPDVIQIHSSWCIDLYKARTIPIIILNQYVYGLHLLKSKYIFFHYQKPDESKQNSGEVEKFKFTQEKVKRQFKKLSKLVKVQNTPKTKLLYLCGRGEQSGILHSTRDPATSPVILKLLAQHGFMYPPPPKLSNCRY